MNIYKTELEKIELSTVICSILRINDFVWVAMGMVHFACIWINLKKKKQKKTKEEEEKVEKLFSVK